MSEDKNFQEVLAKADELEKIDFTSDEKFNVHEYYSVLEKIAKKNESAKNEEAEHIVDEQAKSMIDGEFIEELVKKRKTVEAFIRKYDPNLESTKELELLDVDKVYAISNYLLNSYIQYVNEMKFIVEFDKLEVKFLNKILLNEISYNGDEVFNYAELYNNFWKEAKERYETEKDTETFIFKVSIKSILILHHLIKGYTVKGRTDDFRYFQNILFKIAKINKLFNAYNIIIERIKRDREIWGNAIEEIVKDKDPEYLKQVAQMAKEAAEKSGKFPPVPGMGSDTEMIPITDADFGK
jgi:hypothetical protein